MRRSKKGNTAISEADVKASLTDRASFTDAVKIIGTCKTIEEFWSIYNYLVRPHELPATTDYHFFREGVKPTWEDPYNCKCVCIKYLIFDNLYQMSSHFNELISFTSF